jgi:ankyrin repeat protein
MAAAAALFLVVARVGAEGDSPLVDAVKRQDLAVVNTLLREKADPEARQGDGTSALHWAAHRNNAAIASALMQAGAKVNVANELGVTPLLLACENGNGELVAAFLTAGAHPNAITTAGESPLMAAARSGSSAAVAALLKRGADPNAKEHTRGQTPLMWAVAAQQTGAVRLLLAAGAEVNARTASNRQLVYTGFRYITSPPAESSNTVVEVDLGGFSPILFAAQQGNVEIASLLLDSGANKDEQSPLGQTALIVAAHSNHTGVVHLLLDRGADPNKGDVGYSALHAAVLRGNSDIVNLLLAANADPNARMTRGEPVRKYGQEYALTANWKGATPLWLAARFAEPSIVRTLVSRGADANIPSLDGVPPLLAAVPTGGQADRRERYMTDVEAASRAPDEDEQTSLEVVKALRECGVSLDATDKGGNTLLHLAAIRGYDSVIRFLADRGVDLNAKNGRGVTPLGAAIARRRGGSRTSSSAAASAEPEVATEKNKAIALLQELGAR